MADDPAQPGCPVTDDIADAVANQIIRLSRLRDRTNAQIAAATNGEVEPAAFAILFRLIHDGPMRSGALAEALYSDASTISRQAANLVKRGLIERRADPADGRVSVLAVTAEGRTVAAEIRVRRNEALTEIMTDWTPGEQDTFVGLLTKFVDGYEHTRSTKFAALSAKAGNKILPKIDSAEGNS
ncbi:MarR family transcriptional regulator [Nocardia sp. SYP-A9097]|uniref:MarR family winged helix-turn-helix transcriptional regulator n=1 Tax=Nocardia sp. SYP-A9097 TaxID=2663237 RepID=UPI00132CB070|nr:MarR family transcriptional regulator [Nocardia sp. SYP-A9097]MRH87807.1 MarR family transcriptional regulator [Nocardia sp. SYP-A9097]